MDFDLNAEQQLLKDSIDKLVAREYGFEQRRAISKTELGWSRAFWSLLAEQGFLALSFNEADGGLGYGPVERMLVMEALGRALSLEPYLESVVVVGTLIHLGGSEAQRRSMLPLLCSGDWIGVLAQTEAQSRYRLHDVATTARRDGNEYVLNGGKIVVGHGDSADAYIVSARITGARCDRSGIALFLVNADATGLQRRGYRTQDGLPAADLKLNEVRVAAEARIGAEGQGLILLERAAEAAIAALAAEAVGAMQALLDLTVDYLRQRTQFGSVIGRFQALQHRAAEMLVEVEQARSMAIYAALMVEEPDPVERSRALSSVKLQIGKAARIVSQLAVQLHGGIGVTEEYSVGHYFKRLTMIDMRYGDADYHLDRLADDWPAVA